jgi:hypothetical protein
LSTKDLLPIADQLTVDEKGARLAAELLCAQRARHGNRLDGFGEVALVRSLIGSRQFLETKKSLLADTEALT